MAVVYIQIKNLASLRRRRSLAGNSRGAHFDLARPEAKADKKIQETTDDLKKKGVN